MTLLVDNRAGLDGPGVHVFIVGVSNYQALPDYDDPPAESAWWLNKLTSPCLSAFAFFEAISRLDLRLPLKTVRLLMSPHPLELQARADLAATGASPATRAMFEKHALDWREDAKNDPGDMTVFFFSGHGIQRGPEEGILLLEDFLTPAGAPPLAKCFEIGNIKNGMAPTASFPTIATTQFYFIDACLTRPDTQKKFVNPQVPDVFGVELNSVDRREAPLIFSTVDGAVTLGRSKKTSHFAEALVSALERAADDTQQDSSGATLWPVTALAIRTSLDAYYDYHGLGTKVKMGGIVGLPVLRYLPGPPDVDILVEVHPGDLGTPFEVWLYDDNNTPVPHYNPIGKSSFAGTVKAGIYRVQVDSARLNGTSYRSASKFITQKGPWPWLHNITGLIQP